LDKEVHASVLDGAWMAKALKQATLRFFRHCDVRSLEQILESCPSERAKLVVVDGVFSMSGEIAPLPEILGVCRRHQARLMVDDAHGIGVLGGGRGTAHHFKCADEVDLIMGTFSKSLASTGGFVAGRKDVVNWIRHFARSFIFSASLAPSNAAAALAALRIIGTEPERVDRVNANGEIMRRRLKDLGYNIGGSQTPIVPIIVGDQFRTMQMWSRLYKRGIYVNVALPPAVPVQKSLLRTSYMATHTEEHLERISACFEQLRAHMPMTVEG
jgi:7-keto-8-aminopelargonate synthetase-like enzyme